ncbi:MAG: phospholipase D-like domain-containing protein, partial [Planctomycetaceae bacterium]|nr:phospholipase D-like domain-containing protein [Planctomycetaceae bacterium]
MEHNDLTFFTNEPDRNLYQRFCRILQNNTRYFDVLVGYFRTSGFFRLYESMGRTEKIRILVGLNTDKSTLEIVNAADDKMSLESLSSKEAKTYFSAKLKNEFADSADSYELEAGVKTFIEWLKSGKIEIRLYSESPIHAKVYILRKNLTLASETYGSVITGSSNFSEAGLNHNLEFNVELKDSRDVKFALEKFEELWSKSIDLKNTYIETVTENTWIKGDITPYELYLKTLYEFFEEEINDDKQEFDSKLLPSGYMNLQYQREAVIQARKNLEQYNGTFISDVVGLGKTYICAMLAKQLHEKRKLVICPPVLKEYWEEVLREFDVAAKVESLGKLDQIKSDDKHYDYIFIDEAHRFRNQDTESFKLLHEICYGKKVILISATPINNYSSDIANQIYLFQSKHNSTIIPETKNLEGFFANLDKQLKNHERGTEEYKTIFRKNSEKIRDQILRHIMIRRTRKEIVTEYADDLNKQGLFFPTLGKPKQIVYEFDNKINDAFKKTMSNIQHLDYVRYAPLIYLKNKEKVTTMITAQYNMSGFMKSILVKRLESSFYAFRHTLERFIQSYKKFIEMVKAGDVYISKKINVYDLLDSGEVETLMDLVDKGTAQHFKTDEFEPKFLTYLERDLGILIQLQQDWKQIKKDPKIEQFKKELQENSILKNSKIIVFTESKETAEYLSQNLKEIYGERIVMFTGASSGTLKKEIERSFNPFYETAESEDQFDILISTDVLAEGINLHRSNIVINYDLPWNPTKIMQRVGRINRVGTKHKEIHVFNFFPTAQSDKHLTLRDRIIEKIQAFHDTLGEDFKYLTDDEEVSSHKLYKDLTSLQEDDGEGVNPELTYLKVIRKIRDEEPILFEKIKHLPLKAKAGKINNKITEPATITFLRKGFVKQFYLTDEGRTRRLLFLEAVEKYILSQKNDQEISVDKDYYDHLDKNKRTFDETLNQNVEETLEKTAVTGNDAKVLKILKSILKCKLLVKDQESQTRKMIELWENGEISKRLTNEIIRKVKDKQGSTDEEKLQLFNSIYGLIPN